ncbi:hypothetical protein [Caulobacter sp.]|uniref:hypothetical protein n=1 Tax=Caulobacter sp. TaxID=78 RepID=UPI002B4A616F|nr:hypothetical protein [Caulobacter sp.]HJV43436.1 hypothetical protein [Caulobacter sp.]
MSDCPELQRVTTQYVAAEDRMRLSGETADGATVVLWLTQRLLNLLAPQLTRWLERQGVADVMDSELAQGFAQEAAEASLTAEPAVQAVSPAGAWLVESVDIHIGTDGVILTFKAEDGAVANLTLMTQALRQWLGIVRGQYGVGGWPRDVWPTWMGETHALAIKPSTTALH